MSLPKQIPPCDSSRYNPPRYLLSRTGLSRDILISEYEDFLDGLQHVQTSPALVFERLVGNLNDRFSEILTKERTKHAVTQEVWLREKSELNAEIDRLAPEAKQFNQVPADSSALITAAPASIPVAIAPTQPVYLGFWNCPSADKLVTRVRAAATTIPIPYTLSSSWIDATDISDTCTHGTYDTRMDGHITSPTLPTAITHVVQFRGGFHRPPRVMVWLTGLSAPSGAAVSVRVTANDVERKGFKLQITCAVDTLVTSVGVAWAAWADFDALGDRSAIPGLIRTDISPTRRSRLRQYGSFLSEHIAMNRLLEICEVDLMLEENLWIEMFLAMPADQDGQVMNLMKEMRYGMRAGPETAMIYSVKAVYTG